MRRPLFFCLALAAATASADVTPERLLPRRAQLTGPSVVRADGTVHAFAPRPKADRVIVELRGSKLNELRADLAGIVRARSAKGAQPHANIVREYRTVYSGAAIEASADVVDDVRRLDYVVAIHPDVEVEALLDKSVPLIGAPKVWTDHGTRGAGVVVAVIDTGIDYRHPALGGGFGAGRKVIGGHDFVNNDGDPMDDAGHGTHVAGIIAADGEVKGVAPDASLVAYKVLNAGGSGRISDVIAGIDRAVDPNGDGDPSDGADVINLSLGSRLGTPDDPTSKAVDNAVAKGVVVCVAAGNAGAGFAIGSPGMARSAITVGATNDDDAIATFSSRGPNADIYTIKPELTAPGQAIRSTLRNGQYGDLNGTSMATPHVAGAAALLKALHPEWTPADIKSALVNTAHEIEGGVMAAGAGRLDVAAAARASVHADPPALSYGLGDGVAAQWNAPQTIRLTNRDSAPRSFTLGSVSGLLPGVSLTMSPATVEVPANGSATAELRLVVTNAEVPYPRTESLSYGGVASLVADGVTVNVPWAFVKAARVVVFDGPNWTDAVLDDGERPWIARRSLQPERTEVLVPAGTYDVVMFAPTTATSNDYQHPHLVVRERQAIEGTVTFTLTGAEFPNTVSFRGVDEQGRRLAALEQTASAAYASRVSVRIPDGADWFFDSWVMPADHIRTSAFSGRVRLLAGEFFNDVSRRVTYVVQHPPPAKVDTALVELTTTPEMLVAQDAVLEGAPQLGADAAVVSTFARFHHFPDFTYQEDIGLVPGFIHERQQKARVYLTPEPDPKSGYSTDLMLFSASINAPWDFMTQPFRVTADGKVTNALDPTPSPRSLFTDSSEERQYGLAPYWPSLLGYLWPTRALVFGNYFGAYGETRFRDWIEKRYAVFDETGAVIAGGTGSVLVDLPAAARYAIRVESDGYYVGDVRGRSTLNTVFDTRSADRVLPTLTSLFVRDARGRVVFEVPRGRPATLELSAADYDFYEIHVEYRQVDLSRTRVWARRSGTVEWQPLAIASGEEEGGRSDVLGHWPTGLVWRASLAPVLGAEGTVDLRIELADTAGHMTQWILEPAFRVVDAPRKRRSVR